MADKARFAPSMRNHEVEAPVFRWVPINAALIAAQSGGELDIGMTAITFTADATIVVEMLGTPTGSTDTIAGKQGMFFPGYFRKIVSVTVDDVVYGGLGLPV